MFGTAEGRDRFDESVLDSNLRLAYNQGDIGTEEFLQSGIFDTTGSFSLAYDIYKGASSEEESMKLLAQLFNGESGKAYAGTERAGSETYERRVEVFLEYFSEQIDTAETALSSEVFFEGIFENDPAMAAAGIKDSTRLDGELMIKNMLANSEMTGVGGLLGNALILRNAYLDALNGGPGDITQGQYLGLLNSLTSTGAFITDTRHNFFDLGNQQAMDEHFSYVENQQNAYEGGIRRMNAGGWESVYKDGDNYYKTQVGFNKETSQLSDLGTEIISMEEYQRIQDIESGTNVEAAQAAIDNLNNKTAEYIMNGQMGAYLEQMAELTRQYEEAVDERDAWSYASYCNVNTSGLSVKMGVERLQYDGKTEYKANGAIDRLRGGLGNEQGRYIQISGNYVDKFAEWSMFSFATKYNSDGGSGHMAPARGNGIYGNVGATFDLNADKYTAFKSNDLQYWLWLNW